MNINISKYLNDNNFNIKNKHINLNIDISKEEFIKNIRYLYENVLYVMYINNNKVNIINNINICNIKISPMTLHYNKESLSMHLYLEAWHFLSEYLKTNKKIKINHYKNAFYSVEQLKVINHSKGPNLVLSSAGSGKTTTLVKTVNNLIRSNISEDEILVLTYNKLAKEELIERLNNNKVKVKTYHSFCDELIRENTTLVFEEDMFSINKHIIDNILEEENIKNENLSIEVIKLFDSIKENLYNFEDINLRYFNKKLDVFKLFNKYIKEFEKQQNYNFTDMIYLSLILLLKNPSLRNYYQSKYKYILVDEYQDINEAQKMLVKILSFPFFNLLVFGDDDQTIYEFRGASYKNILNFKDEYPKCIISYLTTNYRSKKMIVNASKRLIDNNINRFNKDINAKSIENGKIFINTFNNMLDQINYVINICKKDINNTIILYRYQKDEKLIELFLTINGFNKNKELYTLLLKQKNKNYLIKELSYLKEYFKEYIIVNYIKNSLKRYKKDIIFSTIHKTKGKEYEKVVIFNVLDNILNSNIEEERRIFYVGVTRAKSNLYITKLKGVNNVFVTEVFLNKEFELLTNKKLYEKLKSLKEDVNEYHLLTKLQKKNINSIKDYVVSDNDYYYVKIKNKYNMNKKKYNKIKEKLQEVEDEIYFRKIIK